VAVKIKLKRLGKIRAPYYRIVVADARAKRDGRAIEELGKYHPTEEPSFIQVDSPRVQYWLGVGAQPTEAVAAILRVTGDWQTFRGEPGGEGTLRTAEPKADKRAIFEAAAKESGEESRDGATTPRSRRAPRKDTASSAEGGTSPAESPAADSAAEVPAADAATEAAPAEQAEAPAPEQQSDVPAADEQSDVPAAEEQSESAAEEQSESAASEEAGASTEESSTAEAQRRDEA
jgi:small subunit ribosomal protein S16